MIRLLSALTLTLALSGCAESETPVFSPGDCIAAETHDLGRRVPDLSRVVPCTEPHVYEVFDVLDLPTRALPENWIHQRSELAHSVPRAESSEQKALREFSERECLKSFQRVTGFAGVTVNGKAAAAIALIPAMPGVDAPWASLVPERHWRAGNPQVVCSARFGRASGSAFGRRLVEPRTSPRDEPLVSLVSTGRFPDSMRECRAYDEDREQVSFVSCAQTHVSETLFYFDADRAMGQTFAAELAADPSPERFDRLDRVCTRTLPQVLGKGYDTKAHRGFASVPREWTPTDHPVQCAVGPRDFREEDLPRGSLVHVNRPVPTPEATPEFTWRTPPEWLPKPVERLADR